MKSIWYISKYFAPGARGDVGTRAWYILKEFRVRGIDVVAITSDSNHLADCPKFQGDSFHEVMDGVRIVWLKTFKYYKASSLLRILNWIHFEWKLLFLGKASLPRPDVIIVSSLSLLTILNGLLLKYKFQCKLVFEVRDIWPLTIIEEGGYSRWNPFVVVLSIIEYLGYRYSNLVVGTMPNLKEHVLNLTEHGGNVVCIPMGVSNEMLEVGASVSDEYLDKYLDPSFFNVVHAGTVGTTNALETLFAAAEIMQCYKKIRFIIIGDGALKEDYERRYSNLFNVVFAPKVSKFQVNSVLSRSSLVYFSTFNSQVWRYGQSLNKVIDYMLSGRPILASYSGYPSMINEAGCGFFVPAEDPVALANKIVELYDMDPDVLSLMGKKGRPWLIENRGFKMLADYYLDSIKRA